MAKMIEWKHEKSLVDYKFAEMAMSRRVNDIIAKQKTELVWFLEHDNRTPGNLLFNRGFLLCPTPSEFAFERVLHKEVSMAPLETCMRTIGGVSIRNAASDRILI